jgi:hypothetical protein
VAQDRPRAQTVGAVLGVDEPAKRAHDVHRRLRHVLFALFACFLQRRQSTQAFMSRCHTILKKVNRKYTVKAFNFDLHGNFELFFFLRILQLH